MEECRNHRREAEKRHREREVALAAMKKAYLMAQLAKKERLTQKKEKREADVRATVLVPLSEAKERLETVESDGAKKKYLKAQLQAWMDRSKTLREGLLKRGWIGKNKGIDQMLQLIEQCEKQEPSLVANSGLAVKSPF